MKFLIALTKPDTILCATVGLSIIPNVTLASWYPVVKSTTINAALIHTTALEANFNTLWALSEANLLVIFIESSDAKPSISIFLSIGNFLSLLQNLTIPLLISWLYANNVADASSPLALVAALVTATADLEALLIALPAVVLLNNAVVTDLLPVTKPLTKFSFILSDNDAVLFWYEALNDLISAVSTTSLVLVSI